jgi:hypothetical protein
MYWTSRYWALIADSHAPAPKLAANARSNGTGKNSKWQVGTMR